MAIAFVLPFTACEEEKESDMSLLTSGTWNLTFVESGGVRQTAAQAQMQVSLSFTAAGTWAGSVSSGGVPELQSGTYTLTGRNLAVNDGGDIETWKITLLTKQSLTVEFVIEDVLTRYEFAK